MLSATFTKVVLPAPFGPSNPKMVPGWTENVTSCRAWTFLLDHQRRNVFDRETASKAGNMTAIIAAGHAKTLTRLAAA